MPELNAFNIDPKHHVAIYKQIENVIMFAIATKSVKEGQTLPSVRELAMTLDVNQNTVTKAYRDLEILGFLESRRGIGVTVRHDVISQCRKMVRASSKSHLRDAVGESMASGVSAGEIRKQIERTIKSGFLPYGERRSDR